MPEDTFLTPSQIKILELRSRGCTQREIASRLGTTRADVSIIERRARRNVEKARKTIATFEKLVAPVKVNLSAGSDLFDAPQRVFTQASRANIKVKENSLSLVDKIRSQVPQKLRGRNVREKIVIAVKSDGEVLVE